MRFDIQTINNQPNKRTRVLPAAYIYTNIKMYIVSSSLLTSKNGVGSNIGLVVGSIGLDHSLVNGTLVGGIDSHDDIGQDGLDVFDGLQATLSEVSGTSVTEFVGLVGTGGGTGWDTGGVGSGGGGDIDLDGRISSGIDDFAGVDTGDGGHHALGGNTGVGLSGNGAGELGQHGEWMD